MKVKELIEELQKLDPELPVYYGPDWNLEDVNYVDVNTSAMELHEHHVLFQTQGDGQVRVSHDVCERFLEVCLQKVRKGKKKDKEKPQHLFHQITFNGENKETWVLAKDIASPSPAIPYYHYRYAQKDYEIAGTLPLTDKIVTIRRSTKGSIVDE